MPRSDLRSPLDPDLVLVDLDVADGDTLTAGAVVSGECYSSVDLGDRDMRGIHLSEVALDDIRAHGASLRSATISETTIQRLDAPVLDAARSRWRTVVVSDSRIGSLSAFDSHVDVVRFERCRIGFANLRGSTLMDVVFSDCTIDELDVTDATLERLAAPGSTIRLLAVHGATLAHVDFSGCALESVDHAVSLRGATLSSEQLWALRSPVAAALGIRLAQ